MDRARREGDVVNDEERPTDERAGGDPAPTTQASPQPHGLKAAQARVAEQMTEVRQRLEDARPRSRTVDSAFLAVARDTESGGGVLAAALAFRVFLFMIPYILVVVVLFDVAGTVADKDPHAVAKSAGIGGLTAQAVSASTKHLSGAARFYALAAGLVGLYLGALGLLKTLRIVHGLVWRVRVNKLARPVRAVLVVVVLVTAMLLLSVAIDHLRRVTGLGALGATVLFTVLPCGVWWLLEYGLPHAPRAGWKDLLPGAILFGVAVLGLHLLTVYWVSHLIKRRSATYGAIGAALALLFWAYVFGRIMTASAVLNASMWSRAHPRPSDEGPAGPATAPGQRLDVNEVIDRLSGPDVTR
jgi:uncharacterized BrkB/YihY/UPF0761 family membrane protein